MNYLKLYEIGEIRGIRVQCRPIDPEWEDRSDNACAWHKCAFTDQVCEDIACRPLEREDTEAVYFKSIVCCNDHECVHHACMSDDCMYNQENNHLGQKNCEP